MLEVENLSKTYYSGFWNNLKIDAVKNISFKVNEGEIFGLIGGSGCGKTTASRMIAGFLKPSSGRILFENQNVVSLKRKEWFSLRKKMQMVFQNPHMTFNPRFISVAQNRFAFFIWQKIRKKNMKGYVKCLIILEFHEIK